MEDFLQKIKPEDTFVGKAQAAYKSVKRLHFLLDEFSSEIYSLQDLLSIYGEPKTVVAILEDITRRANLLYERKGGELNE